MAERRKFRKSSNFHRRTGIIFPVVTIYIVCEGKNTEPKYVDAFARDHGNGRVRIEEISGVGDPRTLVLAAIDLKKRKKREAKKSGDSFDENPNVWVVFDTDEHFHIPEALQLAQRHTIPVCISNPCVELWGLLHIKDHDAEIHRRDLQSKLKREMPGYDHKKGAEFNYDFIKGEYLTAKRRAQKINQRRAEEGAPGGNPSTDIYRLLDEIIRNGKK